MAMCPNCGTEVPEGAQYCSFCGAQMVSQQNINTEGSTHSAQNVDNKKLMGVLSYLGILVIIPIWAVKDSVFVRFHANQGLLNCIATIAYSLVTGIVNRVCYAVSYPLGLGVSTVFNLGELFFLALAIIGIVNVCKGEMKELPLIGRFRIMN